RCQPYTERRTMAWPPIQLWVEPNKQRAPGTGRWPAGDPGPGGGSPIQIGGAGPTVVGEQKGPPLAQGLVPGSPAFQAVAGGYERSEQNFLDALGKLRGNYAGGGFGQQVM